MLCRKAFRVRQTEKRLGINDLPRSSKKDTYPKEFCNSLISAASLQSWLKFKPLPILATNNTFAGTCGAAADDDKATNMNGVDVESLVKTVEAVASEPSLGSFEFRCSTQWKEGAVVEALCVTVCAIPYTLRLALFTMATPLAVNFLLKTLLRAQLVSSLVSKQEETIAL